MGVVLIRLPLIRLPSPLFGFVCTVRLRLTFEPEWVRGRQGQGGAEVLVLATPVSSFGELSDFGLRVSDLPSPATRNELDAALVAADAPKSLRRLASRALRAGAENVLETVGLSSKRSLRADLGVEKLSEPETAL